MISYEDVESQLSDAITEFAEGARVLDVGAGTGRVSRLARPLADKVITTDLNAEMLTVAQQLEPDGSFAVADALHLPVADGWADVVVAGWALGHFIDWFKDWPRRIDRALDEMTRASTSSGAQIIIETLGTGSKKPAPPTDGLAAYYVHLEQKHGFERRVLRTDYRFPDVATGARLVGFFFGDELAERLTQRNSVDLIEWTGFWQRVGK